MLCLFLFFHLVNSYHITHNLNPLQASSKCYGYSCAPTNYPMPSNYCVQFNSNMFYLIPCEGSNQFCNTYNGLCTNINGSTVSLAYPGEYCTINSDCKSNSCVSNTCKGKTVSEACNLNEECDPAYYCSPANECQEQLIETS